MVIKMEIFVGCGSSNKIDKKYLKSAYELGTIIGKNGHTLIFGSSDEGMMGELYRGAKENNCNIISVYPKDYKGFLKEVECKKTITVETTSDKTCKTRRCNDHNARKFWNINRINGINILEKS